MITNSGTSSGNIHDSDYLMEMVAGPLPQVVTADKIYDSTYNHKQLEKQGIKSHISRKKRSQKPKTLEYQRAIKLRQHIERFFAVLKKHHGCGRARYWGRAKVTIQNLLTAILYDLKVLVILLPQFLGQVALSQYK